MWRGGKIIMLRLKGIAMIVFGAILWGTTGPMMEWILNSDSLSVSTLIFFRLLLAGSMILIYLKLKKKPISIIWRQKIWGRQTILFGIIGVLGAQFAFTQSINTSNAVIATLFQFLAPVYIITFVSLKVKRVPPIAQIAGMIVTLIGLFFLLTNGSLADFALSTEAVIWGVLVGLTFSFYTLYPAQLLAEWGVLLPVGWAMLIGGIAQFLFAPATIIREIPLLVDLKLTGVLILVVVLGTIAFVMFLSSMTYITPIETSILSSFEPLTTIVVSAIWFSQMLGSWQLTGALIMLGGVSWLSIAGSRTRAKKEEEPTDISVEKFPDEKYFEDEFFD